MTLPLPPEQVEIIEDMFSKIDCAIAVVLRDGNAVGVHCFQPPNAQTLEVLEAATEAYRKTIEKEREKEREEDAKFKRRHVQ